MAALRVKNLFFLAWRDLRGGGRGLRVFVLCTILGVAGIAAVATLSASLHAALRKDAKAILGGDVEMSRMYKPLPPRAQAFLQFNGELSKTREMRAMAEAGEQRLLVEMKAVDTRYPLYGSLELETKLPREAVFRLNPRKQRFGAAVERSLLKELGIGIGDVFSIGDAEFAVRAVITHEPDRPLQLFAFGPRVMVSHPGFGATGLVQPGSLVNHRYRVKLPERADIAAWKQRFHETFPKANWSVRDYQYAAPSLNQAFDRLTLFFALTAITALLIGGVGIANATESYLQGKQKTLAVLKCFGATQRQVHGIYLLQVLLAAAGATLVGLMLGMSAATGLSHLLKDALPVQPAAGIYPRALGIAGLFGILNALLFTVLPLARTAGVRPAILLRGEAEAPSRRMPGAFSLLLMALLAAGMIGLAILFTGERKIPLWYAGGMTVAAITLFCLAKIIERLARAGARMRRPALPLALALRYLGERGATASTMLALGLSMTLLLTLVLVAGNLRAQIQEGLPKNAPALFLIDIANSKLEPLEEAVKAVEGVSEFATLPMLRGKITKLNGKPAEEENVSEEARWALRSERGITFVEPMPERTRLAAGKWWPPVYDGPPLVSFDAALARGMGLKLGDSISLDVLGQEVTATIASLRDVHWGSLQMNFTVILSPGAIKSTAFRHIATVTATDEAEADVRGLLREQFPDITVIHVRAAMQAAGRPLSHIAQAVLLLAMLSVAAGMLVMGSAVTAVLQQRLKEYSIYKVLGATHRTLLAAAALEFGLLALTVAAVACLLGTAGGWLIMQRMVFSDFQPFPGLLLLTAGLSLFIAVTIGLTAAGRTLRAARPLALLRNE